MDEERDGLAVDEGVKNHSDPHSKVCEDARGRDPNADSWGEAGVAASGGGGCEGMVMFWSEKLSRFRESFRSILAFAIETRWLDSLDNGLGLFLEST